MLYNDGSLTRRFLCYNFVSAQGHAQRDHFPSKSDLSNQPGDKQLRQEDASYSSMADRLMFRDGCQVGDDCNRCHYA